MRCLPSCEVVDLLECANYDAKHRIAVLSIRFAIDGRVKLSALDCNT